MATSKTTTTTQAQKKEIAYHARKKMQLAEYLQREFRLSDYQTAVLITQIWPDVLRCTPHDQKLRKGLDKVHVRSLARYMGAVNCLRWLERCRFQESIWPAELVKLRDTELAIETALKSDDYIEHRVAQQRHLLALEAADSALSIQ